MQRFGGALLIISGVLYILNLAVVISQGGALPSIGSQILAWVAPRIFIFQAVLIVFFAIDSMIALGFASLFLALKGSSRTFAAVGGVLAIVGTAVDLVNTVLLYTLVGLSNSFASASSDASRASYAAIAELVSSVATGVGQSFFFVLFSIAILAVSVAMFAAGSWKAPAYLGVVAGVLGIAGGVSGFVPLIVLWPVWFVVAGARLLKSGRSTPHS